MTRASRFSLGVLSVSVLVYALIPLPSGPSAAVYDAIAASALVVAWVRLRRQRPARSAGWGLLLTGFSAWVVGDLVWSLEKHIFTGVGYPGYSDAIYLLGYALLIAGCLVFVRRRGDDRNLSAILDSTIIAAGVAVPAFVFVITPVALDSSLSTFARAVSIGYPVGDILLLGLLVRLITTPGARSWSFVCLVGGLGATLAADIWWSINIIVSPTGESIKWMDALWLSTYVLIAAAVAHPSMHGLTDSPPRAANLPSPVRLVFLALGSLLPAATLLIAGTGEAVIPWLSISVGGAVLSLLVLARMADLLETVREQAVQLAALARTDALTGAPNRRTWDHELSRACASARDTGEPLCVAILDLDHFKEYNDTLGHPAGDRLLQETVSGWTALLAEGDVLARYGGEEFAVLMSRTELGDAVRRIETLRLHMPEGQTVSAGVASWMVGTDPGEAIAQADLALYVAKRSGRNRVESADPPGRSAAQAGSVTERQSPV